MTRLTVFACFVLAAANVWSQNSIRLRSRPLSPTGSPAISRLAGGHYIFGFRSYPDRDLRAALARRGIRVLQYVPDSALMVSVPAGATLDGLDLAFTAALDADDKVARVLKDSSTNTYLVIFHADIEAASARELTRASGFDLIDHPSLLPNQLVAVGPFDRLRALAANDEVEYVLPASPELASGVPVVPCPGAITEAGPVGEYVLIGRGWPKDAGGTVALQYVIQSLTEKADPNLVQSEIERAIREWTRYANVRLAPGNPSGLLRTIAIRFARGAHGDDFSFDGPGKILAHTFYPAPPNSEPAAGDLHMDADEDWQVGSGLDIFSVVLHELGHALGLGHSTNPGAVMYPYYRVAAGLAADDISGIQELYGAPAAAVQPPAGPDGPSLQPPTTPPTAPPTGPAQPSGPTEPPLQPPSTPSQPPTTPSQPSGPSEPPLQPPTTPSQPPTTPTQPPATQPPSDPPTAPAQPPTTANDTTAPSLRIVSPAATIVSTTAGAISVSGTAADNVGVVSVSWTTSSGTSGTATGTTSWSTNIPLLVGTNTVSVRAFDAAGNSSWRAVTVVRR